MRMLPLFFSVKGLLKKKEAQSSGQYCGKQEAGKQSVALVILVSLNVIDVQKHCTFAAEMLWDSV